MIKVGILTFSFALNYGSLLQAYALQEVLETKGYSACIIDLEEFNEENALPVKERIRKKIIKIVSNFDFLPVIRKRNDKIEKFEAFRKHFNLTMKCHDIAELQHIADDLDVIIVGSDQVWNTHLKDFTYLFMLPVDNIRKIGYSVSLGWASETDLKEYQKEIQKFAAISVREETSKQLVRSIYKSDIAVTADPTLLVDTATWNMISESTTISVEKPFLLCFLFAKNRKYSREKYRFVNEIAKSKNLKVIYLNHGYNKYSFREDAFCDCGIEDFLYLFRNASAVVTDSFHGTVFSIIYRREFYSIVDNSNTDRRKQGLLNRLGLEKRAVDVNEKINEVQDESIDYEAVAQKLYQMKEESLDFLDKEIGKTYGA